MALPDKKEMNRWYALIVLLIFLALIYFMFFQGFVAEHSLLNEEIAELEENREEYTALAALIPELQSRINTVKEKVGDNTSFLVADSYNLGTAELTRALKRVVADNTSESTECQTISNTPSKDRDPDQFERIILKVRMRCQYEKMIDVLLDMENHVPYLFIDNLQLEQRVVGRSRRNTPKTHPVLEVKFDLQAYMNKPIRVKSDDKK